jgi:hypothetical protein
MFNVDLCEASSEHAILQQAGVMGRSTNIPREGNQCYSKLDDRGRGRDVINRLALCKQKEMLMITKQEQRLD